MLDLLVKNALIVESDRVFHGSLGAKDGKTVLVTSIDTAEEAATTIDADGKLVFPGAIDCHAHLNDPGFTWREDFPHGSKAAAVGGTTTVIDMPLQNEPALTSAESFVNKEKAIAGKSAVDYCFWGGLVDNNLEEITGMADLGAVALKAFIAPVSLGYTSVDMGLVRQAMRIAASRGILLGFHCEDHAIILREEALAKAENRTSRVDFLRSRPVVAEVVATAGILALAKETGARVHICHVSHPEVAEMVKQAQRDGVHVTAETCSHYLIFCEDDLLDKGMLFKCAPPLRSRTDMQLLWSYVMDGTLSCIGSDHSPCEEREKSEEHLGVFGAWGGISGIQSMTQVFYDVAVNRQHQSPTIVANRLSRGPAEAFGIYGRKGAIAPGFDADYCMLDQNQQWEITADSLNYKNKISAFVGQKGKGLPVMTILRGKIVAAEGVLLNENSGALVLKNR